MNTHPKFPQVGRVYQGESPRALPRYVAGTFNGEVWYQTCANPSRPWEKVNRRCSLKAFKRWARSSQVATKPFHFSPEHVFLQACREVVAREGEALTRTAPIKAQVSRIRGGSCRYYMDDRIVIVVNEEGGAMNVDRLPVDDPARPHLKHFNPVINVDDEGVPYRFHGEWRALEDHVKSLLGESP